MTWDLGTGQQGRAVGQAPGSMRVAARGMARQCRVAQLLECSFATEVLLTLHQPRGPTEGLLTHGVLVRVRVQPKNLRSSKFPSDAKAAGVGSTLGEP